MPVIRPQKGIPEYVIKQSPTAIMPKVPMRALAVGPGSAGKTVMLSALILDKDKFRGVFSRIFIWSPSVKVDDSWGPVRDYIRKELGHNEEQEGPFMFETFNQADMDRVVRRQQKITETLKKVYAEKHYKGQKRLYQVLFLVDDMADSPQTVRKAGGALESCYVRYRHFNISTIISTQALKLISPCIRKNLTAGFFFRMRNASELVLGILEEFSALVPRDVLMKLYKAATAEPFQFLYIDFLAPSVDQMFYKSFESRLVPRAGSEEEIAATEKASQEANAPQSAGAVQRDGQRAQGSGGQGLGGDVAGSRPKGRG